MTRTQTNNSRWHKLYTFNKQLKLTLTDIYLHYIQHRRVNTLNSNAQQAWTIHYFNSSIIRLEMSWKKANHSFLPRITGHTRRSTKTHPDLGKPRSGKVPALHLVWPVMHSKHEWFAISFTDQVYLVEQLFYQLVFLSIFLAPLLNIFVWNETLWFWQI